MASGARLSLPDPDSTDPERPLPALTGDLLEEILLRVASPADLARASAACVSFRRLIADHAFLRRYRSIHPPLFLGFVSFRGFHPAEAPHPSAAIARAVTFSFDNDYLPPTAGWQRWQWLPCDVCDGRVLLKRNRWDLMVSDPLSRQYLLLPPITDDLLASIGIQDQDILLSRASFIPSGGIEEDTSFSVISWMQSRGLGWLGVLIFSSASGCWSVSTSISWGDLGLDRIGMLISSQCAYNCFYWSLNYMNMLIKLNINSMQFCTIDLPPGHDQRQIVIVESGESRVAMFSMIYQGTSVDYYTFSQNGSEKSHEWHLKSTIPLPTQYISNWYIYGPAQGYIFMQCFSDEENITNSSYFSLEIKSFHIERVSRTSFPAWASPYFGFPPSMSPRRI